MNRIVIIGRVLRESVKREIPKWNTLKEFEDTEEDYIIIPFYEYLKSSLNEVADIIENYKD